MEIIDYPNIWPCDGKWHDSKDEYEKFRKYIEEFWCNGNMIDSKSIDTGSIPVNSEKKEN